MAGAPMLRPPVPFTGHLVPFLQVARVARPDDVVRLVRSTLRERNDMVEAVDPPFSTIGTDAMRSHRGRNLGPVGNVATALLRGEFGHRLLEVLLCLSLIVSPRSS